jgi:hypothetical protein
MADTEQDPLLRPVTADQQALLDIVGDVLAETADWPIYQYVEAKMDDRGLDLETVLASMPGIRVGRGHYSLVVCNDRSDTGPITLTVAGLAHLQRCGQIISIFLSFLSKLAQARANATYDPHNPIVLEIRSDDLTVGLDMGQIEPMALRTLISSEPGMWHHPITQIGGNVWSVRVSSSIRRFRGIETVEDYVARVRMCFSPPVPTPLPEPASPFELVAAFDYLDVVWQLKFGSPLITWPSGERTARLPTGAGTPAEYDSRLSTLGELLKGLKVQGRHHPKPLRRLAEFLTEVLPAEATTRVAGAIDILDAVTLVRNGAQHVDAVRDGKAVDALPVLGLTFPVVDHEAAWNTIQLHVIAALATIRDEVHATAPAKSAAPTRPTPSSASTPHRSSSGQRRVSRRST